jgi:aspartate/methionine/tyrosine aminotransferase
MFDVLEMANSREAQGHYVARMEIGDTPGFQNISIQKLIQRYATTPYRYSPSRGEKMLISKVIETQWPNYQAENVVIGPANYLVTAALASKTIEGDTVLLPDPGFPTYKLAADFLGLNVIYYDVYLNGVFSFPNLDDLIQTLKVRPKAIIINNPSNPLGTGINYQILLKNLQNFPSLGIEIIFDETYINLVYDETDTYVPNIPATRIRSFSKEYCAPGLRIGYAVGEKTIAGTMSDLISLTISCVPSFIQLAVADYLGSPESIQFTNALKNEMSIRIKYLESLIPKNVLQNRPNAAFYALLNTGVKNGNETFNYLLSHNVSTCPGSKFGNNTDHAIRVSLTGSKNNFEKDVNMLVSALKNWIHF